mmetsp:Transcript_25034/g.31526  ORF Transcript_25034/g.31526 Transcript_25034/m.31526 type:complete len:211 (-) Transcript_25034:659-1291(-)
MAHSAPNIIVSSLRFSAAACLIVEISSRSHPTQCVVSFSLKKSFPNCFARCGICCIIASRILHFPSSARSIIAGNKDCDRRSTPITLFNAPRDEITFKRTSEVVSLNRSRTGGTRSVIVASFPKCDESSVATIPRAALTFSLSSSVNVVTFLTSRFATDERGHLLSSSDVSAEPLEDGGQGTVQLHFPTSAKFNVAAVLTSASGSCNSFS